MQLFLDRASFERPFFAAYDTTHAALVGAGRTVRGAGKRAAAAQMDRDSLIAFKGQLANHLRAGTLADLPPLRAPYRRIPYCHHLTVGPWKGIFLIDPDRLLAIGLVFSKAPHDFMGRVGELVTLHTRIQPGGGEGGG